MHDNGILFKEAGFIGVIVNEFCALKLNTVYLYLWYLFFILFIKSKTINRIVVSLFGRA